MAHVQKSAFDLIACEHEPIERPQAIQAVCSLLLFDRKTGRLAMGSDNLEDLFGASLADLLGTTANTLFEPGDAAALNQMMHGDEKLASRYLQLRGQREHFVRIFETEGLLGIELDAWENAQDQPIQLGLDIGNSVQNIEEYAARLTNPTDAEMGQFAQFVADEFRKMSGYDRSMVYRFDTDWNGTVIAESRSKNAPSSFKGLSFPSSDIPAQARRLFVLNRVRPVVDISQGSVPLLPAVHPNTGKPVDLSDCSVRAVSPVHVEYLENMGVRATLNIALLAKGKLWGLLSNHHYSAPYRLTPSRAATCRLLAEVFSTELTRITDNTENVAAQRVRDSLRAVRRALLAENARQNLGHLLAEREPEFLKVLGSDGAAFFINGNMFQIGHTPDTATIQDIDARTQKIMAAENNMDFATHFSTGLWPDLTDQLAKTAAGIFALQFPDELCRLILFRAPRPSKVTWGGDPYKRVDGGTEQRVHPRKSFEKFVEATKDRAVPWGAETAAIAREGAIGLSELDWLLAWRKTEIELAESRAEVAHAALHDALTNLPNRRFLTELLENKESSIKTWSAVLRIDLDRFKHINDQFGHAAGDQVLIEVAERLRSQTRKSDFCARVGGDEFVVLGAGTLSTEEVHKMAERLVAVMSQPVVYDNNDCHFGASVGVAFTQKAPENAETLLHRADLALYEAKREGRGRFTTFTQELEERMREDALVKDGMLSAMHDNQFESWYQPQVDAKTLEICGVEALMRWNHPERGILTPDKFLSSAEKIGLIGELDSLGMKRALSDYRQWQANGIAIPKVSLNLSYDRLADPDLITSIKAAGLPATVFSFELLETIYLDETSQAVGWNLNLLRENGLDIEIDDFGTGKTSILSLVRLRPNRLKIDRQLILPIVESAQSRQLVSSIVEIGTSLGIGITAEGVETMEHAKVLRDIGVSVLQGFAFARPMSSQALMAYMKDRCAKSA